MLAQMHKNFLTAIIIRVFNHYELEWRTDGSGFVKLGEINIQQAGGNLVGYAYIHKNASAGNNYYRLKMVDKDGSFEYSPIISIKKSFSANVYPNPTTSVVNVQTEEVLNPNDEWRLTNALGTTIKIQKAGASNAYQFNLEGLPTGIYYLHLLKGNKRVMINKIIKQ